MTRRTSEQFLPREGHKITERQHQIDLLRRSRAWFARWPPDPAPGT